MSKENPNEILVGTSTSIDEHVAKAVYLLEVSLDYALSAL
jgi:hypothetical protein